ncbi:MAG: alpha/beta family hydrolase [Planctomycetota bacterium]
MTKPAQRFTLAGPAGVIEAAIEAPDRDGAIAAAVVCHPHPLFGGTMQNNVVVHAARALAAAGIPAVRFNFRGAGGSSGTHADGVGEPDDLRAVLGDLEHRLPGRRLILAGVSFGAGVSFAVADTHAGIAALIGMGVPLTRREIAPLRTRRPTLIIQGEHDEFGSPAAVHAFARACAGDVQVAIIAGAPHLFLGHLAQVRAAITAFVAPLFDTSPG